jgi:hypothetical protein
MAAAITLRGDCDSGQLRTDEAVPGRRSGANFPERPAEITTHDAPSKPLEVWFQMGGCRGD